MRKKGSLENISNENFIGFDAEWTKNYKIKNGNIPFCFSVVAVRKSDLTIDNLREGNLEFKYVQYYCDHQSEFRELVVQANDCSAMILDRSNTNILCGHQISSDISVLLNMGDAFGIKSIEKLSVLKDVWHNRKSDTALKIVDTRYDIKQPFLGKSRRLVDVCKDFYLDVTQPELGKNSMTKLQNIYFETGNDDIYERISVMNIRHSFCAIILSWLNMYCGAGDKREHLNINKSIYNNLKNDYSWVDSDDFLKLLR